jgi:hypothetical protein
MLRYGRGIFMGWVAGLQLHCCGGGGFGGEDVGPVGGAGAEAFADGVLQDVGPFFFEAFVVAESVLEEVALPAEAGLLGGVAFPGGEAFGDFGFVGEVDEEMEVVRHDEGEVDVPVAAVVVVAEGGEEGFRDGGG